MPTLVPPSKAGKSAKFRPKLRKPAGLDRRYSLRYQISTPPTFNVATLTLVLLATALIFTSNFVLLSLPSWQQWGEALFTQGVTLPKSEQWLAYSPTVPLSLGLAGLLGARLGIWPLVLLITLGLFGLPVFTWGDLSSWLQLPVGGYWLGLLGASWLLSLLIQPTFRLKLPLWQSLLGTVLLPVALVALVHAAGFLGTLVWGAMPWTSWGEVGLWWQQWSRDLLLYDIIFTVLAVQLLRPLRSLLWLVLY